MTYSDDFNIRTTQVKFNDIADAIDGALIRNNGGTTSGTSSSYLSYPSPAWSYPETGAFIILIPHRPNEAGATLNVSDTGAFPILQGGVAIEAGKFLATVPQMLLFTGAGWEIVAGGSIQPTILLPITLDPTNSRLGVNATTPATTVHIKDSNPIIRVEDTDGGYVDLSSDGGSGSLTVKADESNNKTNTNISFRIDGAERVNFSNAGKITASTIDITTGVTTVVPLIGRGAPSQTGNLLELKNSTGTNQFSVGPTGAISAASATLTGALSAASAGLTGALTAASGSFTGAVSGTTGTFTTSVTTPTLASSSGTISTTSNLTVSNGGGSAQTTSDFVVTKRVTGASAGDLSLVSIGTLIHDADNGYRFLNLVSTTGTTAIFDSGGYLKKLSSSIRYKKDIEPLQPQYSENIFQMEPKWFRLKDENNGNPKTWSYYGFIAEEVAQIDRRLVTWSYLPEDLDSETGKPLPNAQLVPESIDYPILSVLLIDQLKILRREVDELKAKVG